MPKTNIKPTLKQRAFLKELSRTLNPTEAAFRVYDCKDRKSAKVIACENLTKLNLSIIELMEKMGLDDEQDMKDLKKLRKAKFTKHFAHEGKVKDTRHYNDNVTRLKALELTLKVKGRLTREGLSVEVTNNNVVNVRPERVYVFSGSRKEVEDNAKERERGVQGLYDSEGASVNRCKEAL